MKSFIVRIFSLCNAFLSELSLSRAAFLTEGNAHSVLTSRRSTSKVTQATRRRKGRAAER